jgi:hypothetical protein
MGCVEQVGDVGFAEPFRLTLASTVHDQPVEHPAAVTGR